MRRRDSFCRRTRPVESPGGEWDRALEIGTNCAPVIPTKKTNPAFKVPLCKPGVMSGAGAGTKLAMG